MQYLGHCCILVSLGVCCLVQAGAADIDWSKIKPKNVIVRSVTKPSGLSPRIVGGQLAVRGQFPWQAALFMDGRSFCGGSLITPSLVLSAAHCTYGMRAISVYLGAHYIQEQFESTRVVYTSLNHTAHPFYNPANRYVDFDISVVRLPLAVILTGFVNTVRLPKLVINQPIPKFEKDRARVSGWGTITDGSSSISSSLNFVDVGVISNTDCMRSFGGAINAAKLCVATTGGLSPCNGDSGGPLVIQESDRNFTQIGVVSFGSGRGCSVGAPAVFTRVTSYQRDFLAAHM